MLLMQIVTLALALATTMLGAAGCGSSSKDGTSSTAASTTASSTIATAPAPLPTTTAALTIATGKPLTHAQLIAAGDPICARANLKLKTMSSATRQDTARLLPQAAGYEHIQATELSKLVPPASLASDWKQIVAGIQKFSELSIKASEYLQAKNTSAAASIVQAANITQRQLTAIAKRNGFKACAVVR
jgi:hypothetical protein